MQSQHAVRISINYMGHGHVEQENHKKYPLSCIEVLQEYKGSLREAIFLRANPACGCLKPVWGFVCLFDFGLLVFCFVFHKVLRL